MNLNNTPFGKSGYAEKVFWRESVKLGKLPVVDSICLWTDVCGFANFLEKAGFDLEIFVNQGSCDVLSLINEVFTKIGCLSYRDSTEMTSDDMDRVVILNDGVAKTVDVRKKLFDPYSISTWLKDAVISHWIALNMIHQKYKTQLGLRTVISCGQRMQYMKEMLSGEDMLIHGENISDWGEAFRKKCFLFNPAQLQMNTAFARSYLIESSGSKKEINKNGFYIDDALFVLLKSRLKESEFERDNETVRIFNEKDVAFEMRIIENIPWSCKHFTTTVSRIGKATVGPGLERDGASFDISGLDV
jgi:hypothetical protein